MTDDHKAREERQWGPDCRRCHDPEFRIDGYCSIYCRDLHDVEQERDALRARLDGATRSIVMKLPDVHTPTVYVPGMTPGTRVLILPARDDDAQKERT